MSGVFKRTSRSMACSYCRKPISPGQRFHTLTQSTGDMRMFCERDRCQTEMYKLKGRQSGGVKRPLPVERG